MSELTVTNLVVNRSHLPMVREANLSVASGKISVVLGANGAGKTTLLEGLSGIIPVAAGRIEIDGVEVQKARTGQRARAGLAHIEQGRTVFTQLSTDDNLRAATQGPTDHAYAIFPELKQRRDIRAGLLSGGEQQMLVIARAILARPKILMIDEMSAGLAPVVVRRLMNIVRELANEGLAILLVEQFAAMALAIGDHAYVLRRGQVVFDGPCGELRDPDKLHDLYLGAAH